MITYEIFKPWEVDLDFHKRSLSTLSMCAADMNLLNQWPDIQYIREVLPTRANYLRTVNRDKLIEFDIRVNGHFIAYFNLIRLCVDLDSSQAVSTMAHECRHLWQYICHSKGRPGTWPDNVWFDIEHDANVYGQRAVTAIKYWPHDAVTSFKILRGEIVV